MGIEYSVHTIHKLEEVFHRQKIIRPLRAQRYDPGTRLSYEIKGIVPARTGHVELEVEKFVGGGYAGQVYRVKALDIKSTEEPIAGLKAGNSYAMKILIPPTGFSRLFRNMVYALSFQGPFSLQVNPAAARAGALWQKLIRRGAGVRLGSERAVVDIFATFVDPTLGSCGEISEWVDGRMWRFEVDDNLDARQKWKVGDPTDGLGSPEFIAKRTFLAHLVELMHEMGAVELARQYEWWTCKSQPNALKRSESNHDPIEGLVAVDFRPGLALLPFLPMCPADFRLIIKGIARGSLVQFDRGNINKLQSFVNEHNEAFNGMHKAIEELKYVEKSYRDSLPDITHHHLKLVYDRRLWSSIMASNIESWKIRSIIEAKIEKRLKQNGFLAAIFFFLGLIPLLGSFVRKLWGRTDYRRHYRRLITSFDYFRRAGRARIAKMLIRWHRAGRVENMRAQKLVEQPLRFFAHLPLSILPAKMHRFFSDWRFTKQALDNIFARPLRLYFRTEAREEWLREMVTHGQKSGMLTNEESARIISQLREPFIQKYLKSLAVHVCTVPVTQIVSVIVAFIYVRLHPELSWQEASIHAGIILGLFQVIPISPGSLVRGLYVTFLVLRERNFKDYSIAFYLSFFKYIGYLAFPIQMAYRYPDLARFMAGHWATGAVHIVPVFGERGALLEHAIFDMFYNYPLTIRRRMRERRKRRSGLKPRHWHVLLCVLAGSAVLALADVIYFHLFGNIPQFGNIWWLALWVPVFASAASATWAGGMRLAKRIFTGTICGAFLGLIYSISNIALRNFLLTKGNVLLTIMQDLGRMATSSLWKVFLFALVAMIGAFAAETRRIKSIPIAPSVGGNSL